MLKFAVFNTLIQELKSDIQIHPFGIGIAERQRFAAEANGGLTHLIATQRQDSHTGEDDVKTTAVKDLVVDDCVLFRDDRGGWHCRYIELLSWNYAGFDENQNVDEIRCRWVCAHELAFFGGWVER